MKIKTSVCLYPETHALVAEIAKQLDRPRAWVVTASVVAGLEQLQKNHRLNQAKKP